MLILNKVLQHSGRMNQKNLPVIVQTQQSTELLSGPSYFHGLVPTS